MHIQKKISRLFLQDVAGGGVGGGGGKGVGATWPDTVKQSGAGGTLTPADRHGSVQVSVPRARCQPVPLTCHDYLSFVTHDNIEIFSFPDKRI